MPFSGDIDINSTQRRRSDILSSPIGTSNRDKGHSKAPSLAQIMYPSHELQTRPQSPSTPDPSPERPNKGPKITVESVCEGLKISADTYTFLYVTTYDHPKSDESSSHSN